MSHKDEDLEFENENFDVVDDDQVKGDVEEEFSDDLSFEDEDAFLESGESSFDDGLNDFDTDFNYDENTAPSSSSSANWFNIGVIGGTVVAIGAIGYFFLPAIFGGNTTPTPQQPVMAVAQNEQPLEPAQPLEESNEPLGLLQNPDLVLTNEDLQMIESQIAQQDETNVFDALNPLEEQTSPDELFDAVRGQPSPPQNRQQDDYAQWEKDMSAVDTLPMPADMDADFGTPMPDIDFPVDELTLPEIPENVSEPDVNMAQQNQQQPVEQPQMAETVRNDVQALNSRIDSLENAILQMTNRFENIESNQENAAPQSVADSQEVSELRQTINSLQNQLASLNQEIQSLRKEPQPQKQVEKEPQPQPQPQPKVTSSAQKKSPSVSTPAPRISYDLRGASTEQAYIARSGTDNLQTVRVGDTVQGLGRITSIAQESGRWVVRATNGTVRQ